MEEQTPILPPEFDAEQAIDQMVGTPELPPERLITPMNPEGKAPATGMGFGANVAGSFRTSGVAGAMTERAQQETVRSGGQQLQTGGFSPQQFKNLPTRVRERILAENSDPVVTDGKLKDAEDDFYSQVAYDNSQANLSIASAAGATVGTFLNPENFLGLSGILVRKFPALAARPMLTAVVDNAAVNAASDVVTQGIRTAGGSQEEFDPLQTAISAVIGGAFGGAMAVPSFVRADLARRVGRGEVTPGGEPAKTNVETPESAPEPLGLVQPEPERAIVPTNEVPNGQEARAVPAEQGVLQPEGGVPEGVAGDQGGVRTDTAIGSAVPEARFGQQAGSETLSARVSQPKIREDLGVDIPGTLLRDLQFGKENTVTAFHGTPHEFEKFSLDKIGTGEGAQAYGHGLYFAQAEDVAKGYRDALSRDQDPRASVNDYIKEMTSEADLMTSDMTAQDVKFDLKNNPTLAKYADNEKLASDIAAAIRGTNADGSVSSEAIAAFKRIDASLPKENAGSLYQVRIKADPAKFLDWDKKIPPQSELRALMKDYAQTFADNPNPAQRNAARAAMLRADKPELTGHGVYQTLAEVLGGDHAAAANALRQDAGIPGVKYLDRASRSGGEGTSNFVVFDDNLIQIIGKDGKPVPINDAIRGAAEARFTEAVQAKAITPELREDLTPPADAKTPAEQIVRAAMETEPKTIGELEAAVVKAANDTAPEGMRVKAESVAEITEKVRVAASQGDAALEPQADFLYRKRGAQPVQPLPPDQVTKGRPAEALTAAPAEPARVTRLEDISRKLVEGFKELARTGMVQPGARGQYNTKTGVIRVRSVVDIDTIAHEVGHGFHLNTAKADVNALISANKGELIKLGAGDKKGDQEAFAELFRLYTTNPMNAAREYPASYLALDTLLKDKYPDQHKTMMETHAQLDALHRAPSGELVTADTISSTPPRFPELQKAFAKDRDPTGRTLYSAMDALYTHSIDKNHAVWKAVEGLQAVARDNGKAINVKPVDDPYILMRMAPGSGGTAATMLEHGVIPKGEVLPQGPSLGSAIEKALGEKWDETGFKEFGAYLTARRMVAEYERFFKGEIPNPPGKYSLADYKKAVADFDGKYANFAAAADDVYAFQRNHLTRAYEKGLYSKAYYDESLKRLDYVPFVRDMADFKDAAEIGTGGQDSKLRYSVMKRFSGSQRAVQNPLESIFKKVHDLEFVIARNDAVNAMARLIDEAGPGSGAIGEHVPSNQLTPQRVDVIEALRQAGKSGNVDEADLKALILQAEDLLEDSTVATLFRQMPINEKGEPIVFRWVDGERRAIRLADGRFGREMYHAFTALSDVERNWFLSVLQTFQATLRAGVTRSPDFLVVNVIRDQFTATGTAGRQYIPFISAVTGALSVLKQTDEAKIYAGQGGLAGGAITEAIDRAEFGKNVWALERAGVVKNVAAGDVLGAGTAFLHKTVKALELSEAATRMGLFESYMKQAKEMGLDTENAALYATFKATDYIDFRKAGASMGWLRRVVPFLNAALQGTDREFRAAGDLVVLETKRAKGLTLTTSELDRLKDARVAMVRVMLLGAVLGGGLAALNADKEEWFTAPEFMRNTNFLFKVHDTWIAIPKPFGIVQTIVNAFERSAEYAIRKDPTLLETWLMAGKDAFSPPVQNPGVSLAYDLPANYDRFRNRPIVPFYLQGVDPSEQYTPGTTELSKWLGRTTGWSPLKIEYAIRNLGGSMATNLLRTSDMAMGTDRPERQIYDWPMAGRFVKNLARGNIATGEFYKLVSEKNGEYEQKEAAYRNKIRNGERTAADQYLRELKPDERVWTTLQALGFSAEAKRLHPMQNARDNVGIVSGMISQLNTNNLIKEGDLDRRDLTRSRRAAEPIALAASTRAKLIEAFQDLSLITARNAMVSVGAKGTNGLKILPIEPTLERLKLLSPDAFAEYTARKESKKVYEPSVTFKAWPEVKARVLRDGENADLKDLIPAGAGRRKRKPATAE